MIDRNHNTVERKFAAFCANFFHSFSLFTATGTVDTIFRTEHRTRVEFTESAIRTLLSLNRKSFGLQPILGFYHV